MITYSYSLIEDFKWMRRTLKQRPFYTANNLYTNYPSFKRTIKLWLKRPPRILINTDQSIKCYWTSSGCFGSFTPPDIIRVCPFTKGGKLITDIKILEGCIRHELTHLIYWPETKDMSFEEREKFVNAKAKENPSI